MVTPDPAKSYFGKICLKHPELRGKRRRSSRTCVQCCRNASAAFQEARSRAQGKSRRIFYSPEEAAERIRQRDLVRNAKRRKTKNYNDTQRERKRAWRKANRERHLATSRAYDAKQLRENIQRRLSKNLRHRICKATFGKTRSASAVRDLGIDIPGFRSYLESRFLDGMTWDNYGKWHIDHITPLRAFDLSDEQQARAACHYSNLQPLWALDNQRKWCKHQAWVEVWRAQKAA